VTHDHACTGLLAAGSLGIPLREVNCKTVTTHDELVEFRSRTRSLPIKNEPETLELPTLQPSSAPSLDRAAASKVKKISISWHPRKHIESDQNFSKLTSVFPPIYSARGWISIAAGDLNKKD
jgi:hypothetical protein